MTYKVIQWGIGQVGAHALRYIHRNPDLELVAAKCATATRFGADTGVLAGLDPSGLQTTDDADAVLRTDADCVLFMPRDALTDPSVPGNGAEEWLEPLLALLESGKNVVSSICAPTHYRHLADGPGFVDRLNKACALGDSTITFTGIDPGFISDILPLSMTGGVGEITQIRTYEILDYSSYPVLESLAALGFGARPEDLGAEAMGAVRNAWGGVPYLMGDALGVEISDIGLDADFALATEPFTTPGGLFVEKGTIAAIRFSVLGNVNGQTRFIINHINRLRTDVAPEWPQVGDHGGYRIEIDSYPPFTADFPMGLPGGTEHSFADAVLMTAARCVNTIPAVVAASPGYKTSVELPLITAKHALFSS